ncbi:50S ribosomal protein L10 [Candidatus Parcubacteria bacterium]|nr:MAG: 50S ribosomal protein L10 [Candidatus Parcubacteria bacterium]
MQTKTQKQEIVSELEDRLRRQKVSIFADIHGISVSLLTQFRRELKELGAELKVAKKTLLARALSSVGIAVDSKELKGEIAVIFGFEDQVAPAKAAAKFAKANDTFKVLRGVLDGKVIEGSGVLALAKLPNREQLLGQVAGAFAAPVRNLAVVLQANIRGLAVALQKVAEQKS